MKNNLLIKFLIKCILFYLAYYVVYEIWLKRIGVIDDLVIGALVSQNHFLLDLLGYDVFVNGQTIGIQGSHGVYIGYPCDGISLMALFVGFIFAFPAKWKSKVFISIVGVVVIHLVNLLRVFLLTVIAHKAPETLDFNHKYTFTLVTYFVVFVGWYIWIKLLQKQR